MRNAMFLVVAQVVGMPLSMLVNAIMARYLGPKDFGYVYLAGTFVAFGFRLLEWGQPGTLPAMVARDRSRAGEILGSGVLSRALLGTLVLAAVVALSVCLGYGAEFLVALVLVFASSVASSFTYACLDTVRGFERTDVTASTVFGQQALIALFVVPTLMSGAGLRGALTAQLVASVVVALVIFRALRSVGVGALSVRRETIRALFAEGAPFLVLSLVNVLQPNLDALLLSKLGSAEAVGWHAAARKLVGALVFPVDALTAALYPTLCRLHREDFMAYRQAVASALRTATIVVVPVALGSALYADVGIRIFSARTFGPAEDNLRVLALFVLLLYFSMTLGAALAAAGRQRAWAVGQSACIAISAIVDPVLVPWFQRRTGNGGLGVCVSTVMSEVLMVAIGFFLAPRGLMDKRLLKQLSIALLAGLAMAIVALLLARCGMSPFFAAPIAALVYVVSLWGCGGLGAEQIEMLRGVVARKMVRRA